MKKDLDDKEIHQLGSKFDIEIREEASYILWHLWKGASLQSCISALTEDEGLYRSLKVAHARKGYDSIRNWNSAYVCSLSSNLPLISRNRCAARQRLWGRGRDTNISNRITA